MHFHLKYLIATVVLLVVEIFIAIFIHDQFIRPFFGDFLAVIFVYCGLRIVFRNAFKVAIISLLIAYFIEVLQYFNFLKITGWAKYKVVAILLGSSFSWLDMLAYTLGFVFILIIENFEIIILFLKPQFLPSRK